MLIKKNKRIFFVLLLFVVTLVFQGCSSRHVGTDYYSGTQGLEINFLDNAPPRVVFEESMADIMMSIWNRGAYDIPPFETFVGLSFDPIYFKEADHDYLLSVRPEGSLANPLAGKSDAWPRGESLSFPLARLYVRNITGTREMPTTTMDLSVCYPYKTFLSETICLDTDIYGVDSNPVCRNARRFTYSSQGAPVAVRRIYVDMLPMGFLEISPDSEVNVPVLDEFGGFIGLEPKYTDEALVRIEPVIRIYVSNVGRGLPFIPREDMGHIDSYNLCSFTDENFNLRDHNKVRLVSVTLDGLEMDCGQKTVINLANRNDFIMCRLTPEQTGYLTHNIQVPLNLEFEYYYRESIKKQIQIQRTS